MEHFEELKVEMIKDFTTDHVRDEMSYQDFLHLDSSITRFRNEIEFIVDHYSCLINGIKYGKYVNMIKKPTDELDDIINDLKSKCFKEMEICKKRHNAEV